MTRLAEATVRVMREEEVSIFRIVIIAFIERLAAARSGSCVAASNVRSVVCFVSFTDDQAETDSLWNAVVGSSGFLVACWLLYVIYDEYIHLRFGWHHFQSELHLNCVKIEESCESGARPSMKRTVRLIRRWLFDLVHH